MLLQAQPPPNPRHNHLLAALPEAELAPLLEHLELVTLQLGDLSYQPGGQLQHAFFPSTSIISLYYVMESGASAMAAGVGCEGMLGLALVLGGNTTSSSAVVLTAGQAWRLDRQVLISEFKRAGKLQVLLLRYTQALMTQMMQTAVCNSHHSVEQRLCRWLLLTLDRVPSSELVM
ncbi:MAG: Crp/Fnr family transcriptional regulator, partial [Pseudomonadota bacterium]